MKSPRLKTTGKAIVIRALANEALLRVKRARIVSTQSLLILNLHRVGAPDERAFSPLSLDLFEALLQYLTKYFELVLFSDLAELPAATRPRAILSFDDGYGDFLDRALPLLDRYRVRVNHNVIPSCIESGLPPLNVLLAAYVEQASRPALEKLRSAGIPIDTSLPPGRLGDSISAFIAALPVTSQDRVREICLPQMLDDGASAAIPMLSREEIREIVSKHEIGAHSFHHASMGIESDDYLRADVKACRQYFLDKLSMRLAIYAFPNGSHRPGQSEILRSEGIEHVLLVGEDFSATDAHVHHRLTFDARFEPEVYFRGTGSYRWPAGSRGVE